MKRRWKKSLRKNQLNDMEESTHYLLKGVLLVGFLWISEPSTKMASKKCVGIIYTWYHDPQIFSSSWGVFPFLCLDEVFAS